MEKKSMAFVVACKKYFGQQPGQSLTEFQAEVRKLTPADKAELAPLLAKELGEPVAEV